MRITSSFYHLTMVTLFCGRVLRYDEHLNIVYCESGGMARFRYLRMPHRTIAFLLPVSQRSNHQGNRTRLLCSLGSHTIGSCRRALISLLGGIADNMYRGEGVLVDFDQGREIAQMRGKPRRRLRGLWRRKRTTVFCKPEQVAGSGEHCCQLLTLKQIDKMLTFNMGEVGVRPNQLNS